MIDDLKAMALFVETVDLGSFKAAGAAQGLSPSVVSYHLTQLEQKYGVTLLYRSTRKLSLTDEGQRFYNHAKQMVASAQAAQEVLTGDSEAPSGTLTLSMPAGIIRSDTLSKLAAFAKHYPKVKLNIIFTDRRVDLIGEGIDLAIRVGPMPDSSLKSRKLGRIDRLLVAAPSFLEGQALPQQPEDLAALPWIKMKMVAPGRTLSHADGRAQQISFNWQVEVDNVEAMHHFAVEGLGIATPPDYMAQADIKAGRLVHLLPDWQVDPMEVHAVWPGNAAKGSLTYRLLEELTNS